MASGMSNPAFDEAYDVDVINSDSKVENENIHQDEKESKKNLGILERGRSQLDGYVEENKKYFRIFGLLLLNILIFTYVTFASIYWYKNNKNDCDLDWCNGYGMLLLIVLIVYSGILYQSVIKKYFGRLIGFFIKPKSIAFNGWPQKNCVRFAGKIIIYFAILIGVIVFLIFDAAASRERWISFGGIIIIIAFGWIFSEYPNRINWSTVLSGIIMQLLFGLFIIRWPVGRAIFECISNKIIVFLNFVKVGSTFAYSSALSDGRNFVFSALPVIFFFGFIIQMLFYCGILQRVISKIGWVLQSLIGTTVCESMNAAGNTFLGMTESVLLIKPYLKELTTSELHTIMCSGFASVSGTTLAAYIGYGAQASHLLTATLMAAPASLAFSKLFFPEIEKSSTTFKELPLHKSKDLSLLDAAINGALSGIPIVLGITANIIAFTSFVAFLDALFSWLGGLVGYSELTFEFALSLIFMPLSWLMGVPWESCDEVGVLIGLKVSVNEFIAYQKLGEFKSAGKLSPRTEAIATFAICGFSNPGALGIMVGALSAMIPEKSEQVTKVALRAVISGSIVCFLTACTAGMLMDETFYSHPSNRTKV